jgi:hypothetical protein
MNMAPSCVSDRWILDHEKNSQIVAGRLRATGSIISRDRAFRLGTARARASRVDLLHRSYLATALKSIGSDLKKMCDVGQR